MQRLSACAAVLLALTMTPIGAHAVVYRFVDVHGNVIYSNVPPSGIPDADPGTESAGGAFLSPRTQRDVRVRRSAAPTPAGFPRVDSSTQKDRDALRRRILEDELREEQILLRQAATRGGRDDVDQHQRNIQSLEKELSYSPR